MRQIKRGVRTEDEFISTAQKVMKFIVRHRETSIWVGVGIIVGVVLLFYFSPKGEEQRPEADLLYTQSVGLMSVGRLQESENILLQLTQQFQNTRPGKVGFYYLGIISYHTGRFDEALNYFDKFLDLQKNDYLLTPSALFGAGFAAEGLKDYERALSYYERVIKNKESPFYFQGMLAYGRINGMLGNTDKAKEVFENLLAENPSHEIASDAEFYLGYFNE